MADRRLLVARTDDQVASSGGQYIFVNDTKQFGNFIVFEELVGASSD